MIPKLFKKLHLRLVRHRRFRRTAPQPSGSAFLITLMTLVLLTMLGLALAFTTQTEMLIGANERIAQRTFYAAESALHLAVARTLELRDKCPFEAEFQDIPAGAPGAQIRSRLEFDTVYPVADPPCEYCQINEEYEYSTNAYYKVNHTVTARGVLFGTDGGGNEVIVAQKTITDMIDVQPWDDNLVPNCSE